MILIVVNNVLFIIFIFLFMTILSLLITLLYHYLKYIKESRGQKRWVYSELNQNAKKNSIVFLGDSLTDFYRTHEFFIKSDIYNRGIASDTTDDIIKRLEDNVLSIKPRKIFIQIGTNDLGNNKSVDYIVNNIDIIIEKIKSALPETEINIISLYPVNVNAIALSRIIVGRRKNSDINEINKKLISLCESKNITYIDVNSHLKDENGNLKKEYTIEGLHISILGYSKITEILKPYVF